MDTCGKARLALTTTYKNKSSNSEQRFPTDPEMPNWAGLHRSS